MNKNDFINIVKPYTMTSVERISCLFDSLEYIRKNNIEGDLIECGVWKGGNILGMMEYLNFFKIYDKKIWMYDTFEGMTKPSDVDIDLNNTKAEQIFDTILCYSSIDEVKKNLSQSKFPIENLKIIIGDVVETLNISENTPDIISLLRLDTDWYFSTKKELEVLYPKLNKKGILIVDDYGHWQGSKKAVDEFFKEKMINKKQIDYTGIIITNDN